MSTAPKGPIVANITFGSAKDLPLLYAHQAVVNFTGTEFYVTVYATAPEPWVGEGPSPDVEARPLARFAFSPVFWLALAQSISDQVRALEAQGVITPEVREAAMKMIIKR